MKKSKYHCRNNIIRTTQRTIDLIDLSKYHLGSKQENAVTERNEIGEKELEGQKHPIFLSATREP